MRAAVMYPPEVMNYNIRSLGMGVYTFATNGAGLLVTFAFPYALEAIGWKTYMINGAWDFVQIAVIVWTWVETRGKSLEEVDELLDGTTHNNAEVILGISAKAADAGEQPISADAMKKDFVQANVKPVD
jgi:hypothetical protein